MAKIKWDETGKHFYETGVSNGVLYLQTKKETGEYAYENGVPWNGLINVNEQPTGADATPLYADNTKYLNLVSREDFEASLDCYTYPDEFAECDGSVSVANGVVIGQQARKPFGLSYRTIIGNDTDGEAYGYKIHLIYGAVAAPSQKSYATVNDNPDAITFSYSLKTTPVTVEGYKPTATLTIDSTKVDEGVMAKIEAVLYGSDSASPRLPLPDEVVELISNK